MNYLRTIGCMGKEEREVYDYYATDPIAVELLLELETFNKKVWEPCCGGNHMTDVLRKHGYNVRNSDIIVRAEGIEQLDFLKSNEIWDGDVITNPPYKFATEFIYKALESVKVGNKVAMFLKLQFLEGKERKKLFEKYPPKTVYVSSSRLKCGKNGNFNSIESSAVAYCWYVWKKGYEGIPELKWFN